MRRSALTALSMLSALVLTPATALAQESAPSTEDLMGEYDQDGSLSLSQEEFERLYEERMQLSAGRGATETGRGQEQDRSPGQGQAQPGAQDNRQSGNIPEGRGAGTAGRIFSNLDGDGDTELSLEELGQVISLIDSEAGAGGTAARQRAEEGQIATGLEPPTSQSASEAATSQNGADIRSAELSTVFAGDVETRRDENIGGQAQGNEEPGNLAGEASGTRQIGTPSRTEPDQRDVEGLVDNDSEGLAGPDSAPREEADEEEG